MSGFFLPVSSCYEGKKLLLHKGDFVYFFDKQLPNPQRNGSLHKKNVSMNWIFNKGQYYHPLMVLYSVHRSSLAKESEKIPFCSKNILNIPTCLLNFIDCTYLRCYDQLRTISRWVFFSSWLCPQCGGYVCFHNKYFLTAPLCKRWRNILFILKT
jgi:hypothetical protein